MSTEQQYDEGGLPSGATEIRNDSDQAERVISWPRYDQGTWLRDVALRDGAGPVGDNEPPVGIPHQLLINGEAPPWPVFNCSLGPVSHEAGLTVTLTILQSDWHTDHAVYETRIGDMRVLAPGDGHGHMDPKPIEHPDGTVTVTVYVRSIVLGTPPTTD